MLSLLWWLTVMLARVPPFSPVAKKCQWLPVNGSISLSPAHFTSMIDGEVELECSCRDWCECVCACVCGFVALQYNICICVCARVEFMTVILASDLSMLYWTNDLKAACEGLQCLSYRAERYVPPTMIYSPNTVNNGLAGDAKLTEIRLLWCGRHARLCIKRWRHLCLCPVCLRWRALDSLRASGAAVNALQSVGTALRFRCRNIFSKDVLTKGWKDKAIVITAEIINQFST